MEDKTTPNSYLLRKNSYTSCFTQFVHLVVEITGSTVYVSREINPGIHFCMKKALKTGKLC